MLISNENPILRIVSVERIRWNEGTFQVAPRAFSVLSFRISGSSAIWTDSKRYDIRTNDILYLPQNTGYTATYTDTEMIAVHFVTQQDDREIELYTFENGEQLFKLFMRLHALWTKKDPGYTTFAMAHLYTILGSLIENETKMNLPAQFLRAVSLINAHYSDNSIHVNNICSAAGISPTIFRQLFKQHYQKTPTEYITELRLEYARNLIASGATIETAAYESGFNDPKYFARIVKKHFQCTPRALKTYGK